jgi:hypothetical protein
MRISTSPDLWAITSYFNPMRYQRRRANYRIFRERLNLPLLAVELAYDSDFELEVNDAEILLQLRARDVMWQKERLLNVALGALPRSCRNVAWMDCDIIFESDEWSERVSLLLDQFALLQLFTNAYHMPRAWLPDEPPPPGTELRRSLPFIITSGMPSETCLETPANVCGSAHGFAWAADRKLVEVHGFYDGSIVGSGDRAMACAAYGCCDVAMRRQLMNEKQKQHYLAWAKPFHEAVRGRVGFVENNLFHLWHGDANRRKRTRHEDFQRFHFDPFQDIAIDSNGSWHWSTDKPEMHEYVRNYFSARKEDG